MASVGSFNEGAEFVLKCSISFNKMKVCDLAPQTDRKTVDLFPCILIRLTTVGKYAETLAIQNSL